MEPTSVRSRVRLWVDRLLWIATGATLTLGAVGSLRWQAVATMLSDSVRPQVDILPPMKVLPAGVFWTRTGDVHFGVEEPPDDHASPVTDECWSLGGSDKRRVEISWPFAMATTEVTQQQYQAVMGMNPSEFRHKKRAANHPVENVSWLDAVAYCNKLSELQGLEKCYEIQRETVRWPRGLNCNGYRLPTEAEWEYAARAQERTVYAGSNLADEVAWFDEDPVSGATHPVMGKKPNRWGLHDMSGNVEEWVWNEYDLVWHWRGHDDGEVRNYTDPLGPQGDGKQRTTRGGSWLTAGKKVRISAREPLPSSLRHHTIGFRIARSWLP